MTQATRPRRKTKMYIKFALCILAGSIIPIALLTTLITNWMFAAYQDSLESTYTQGFDYATYSVETLVERYNSLSKFMYYYNPSSSVGFFKNYDNSDNLRKILIGDVFGSELSEEERVEKINAEMSVFLNNLLLSDANIEAAHFAYLDKTGEYRLYHEVNKGGVFTNEAAFSQAIDLDSLDKENTSLSIISEHDFDYVGYQFVREEKVITVARNYYNTNTMTTNPEYIGTLLIDFNIEAIANVFENASFEGEGQSYLYQGDTLLYTTSEQQTHPMDTVDFEKLSQDKENFVFVEHLLPFDIYIISYLDSAPLHEQMSTIQQVMYFFLLVSIVGLVGSSLFFSSRLTKPITRLMKQMAQVETGQFGTQIEVVSNDELGDLTARFNQMIAELENYTNQVYVAQIQQKEAELNALKSQIYPHFLYNTLEVIRMTALSRKDEKVAYMIEALSDQIRYLIGTVGDIVPLSLEVDILRKYVYLINARYDEQIDFVVPTEMEEEIFIPKLILQPLVENAFVHGIKPQSMDGTISLQVQKTDTTLELTIMDNGCGMAPEVLQEVVARLTSDLPGRKSDYQWCSIGLKNVHDRIRYLYGAPYGLSMFSTKGLGTAIKVTLPSNIKEGDAL